MNTFFISEDLIVPFKFWYSGHIVEGMRFRNELFGQVLRVPILNRRLFFQQLAWLNVPSSEVMITASEMQYAAWVNLKSPLANDLLPYPNLPGQQGSPCDAPIAPPLQVV